MQRRLFLQTSVASAIWAHYVPKRKYRAVIIGDTGQEDYGHGWDLAWQGIPAVQVVAVAGPDGERRRKAMKITGAPRGYRDYHEMLAKEKPDLATICPTRLGERLPMVTAAAENGAHILIEKPFARDLREADAIVAITEKHGVTVQVGHTARIIPVTMAVKSLLDKGELGVLLEMRGRGKEDGRAGGTDLMVLGTHVFDLMRYFAGDPSWVFAHVSEQGSELRPNMRKQDDSAGLVGGDRVEAVFAFPHGVHGHFSSKLNDGWRRRFGVTLYGSRGFVVLPLTKVPSIAPYMLRGRSWIPERGDERWERVDYPPGEVMSTREDVNRAMAMDLLAAIENKRSPVCSARDSRWTIEMVAGIYQSQWSGGRVALPLSART